MGELANINEFTKEFVTPITLITIIEENWSSEEDLDTLYVRIFSLLASFVRDEFQITDSLREEAQSEVIKRRKQLSKMFLERLKTIKDEFLIQGEIQEGSELDNKISEYKLRIAQVAEKDGKIDNRLLNGLREIEELMDKLQ